MNRAPRIVAALLLALLLPIQGFAAACAQICAQAQADQARQRHAAMMQALDSEAASHCDGSSDLGAGKCCKAHAFMIDAPAAASPATEAFHERALFVARWTNFIPEEPSPPPIAS